MRLLDRIALSSPQQRVVRSVVLVAPLVFLALVGLSAGTFHRNLTAVGVLLAVVVTLVPESNAALALVVYLGIVWGVAASGALDVWTLLASADLFALHLACTLAAYGPPGLVLDSRLLALWRRRAVLCVGAAVLVWLAARVVDLLDLPPSGYALGLALLVFLAWISALAVRLAQAGPD